MFLKNKYTMNYKIIDIPKINNAKGNIGVVENDTIPFDVKRVYYLFDVPSGAKRGGHAHKKLKQVILAISGSFDVVLKDGKSKEIITLNRPDKGLLIENNIWRELENFSSGSVCLVLASEEFSEADYIRNYKDYLSFVKE
jgi:oxalate decarboxylase/phosphoglucose isomerase-like protein (cupin superfamily)